MSYLLLSVLYYKNDIDFMSISNNNDRNKQNSHFNVSNFLMKQSQTKIEFDKVKTNRQMNKKTNI